MVTLYELARHFGVRHRFFLIPMLAVVLLAAILLLATNGLSWVAPLVYTLF